MPAASIFVEGGSGQQTRRGTEFGSRIVVRVFDEMGAWMPGEDVRFSLPVDLTLPTGRFPGNMPEYVVATGPNGQASSELIFADGINGVWVGGVEVVANPAVKNDFYLGNITPRGTPTQIVITANADQKAALFTDYLPVEAWLGDDDGAGVPFTGISMVCPPGRGVFASSGGIGVSALTDASGYVVFPPFTASAMLGFFEPQVSASGVAVAHASFTTIDPAVPVSMSAHAGNNQATPLNVQFGQPLVVRVANGVNGPVAGVAVTFDAPAVSPTLVWSSPYTDPVTRTSDVSGLATSPSLTADTTAGTYVVTVTSPGLPLLYFQLTNGGASPFPDMTALNLCEV